MDALRKPRLLHGFLLRLYRFIRCFSANRVFFKKPVLSFSALVIRCISIAVYRNRLSQVRRLRLEDSGHKVFPSGQQLPHITPLLTGVRPLVGSHAISVESQRW